MKIRSVAISKFHLLLIALGLGLLIGSIALMVRPASANFGDPPVGYDYFRPSKFLGSTGYDHVLATASGGPVLAASTSKTTFENKIISVINSGPASHNGYGYAIGAQFIVQTMRGGTDHSKPSASDIQDWKNRLANPNVVIAVDKGYCNGGDGDHDSGYLNGGVAWLPFYQCGEALVFKNKNTGKVYYIVRIDCGNPIGDVGGLPAYTPNQPPIGQFTSVTCNAAAETYTIKAVWNDPDAGTTAKITGTGGTQYGATLGGTSGTWTLSTKTLTIGTWPIKLWVRDTGPAGSGKYIQVDTNGIPNCPPASSDTAATCTTVSVKLWDPNHPNTSISYYLSVNGATKQGPYVFSGGQSGSPVDKDVSGMPGFDYWKSNVVTIYGVDIDTGGQYNAGSVTLPTCGSVSCGTSTMPATVLASQPQSFTVSVKLSGPAGMPMPSGASFSPIKVGAQTTSSPANYTSPPPTGTSNTQTYTPPTAGIYTLTWTFGGGDIPAANSVTCSTSFQAGYIPYFAVDGGDFAAGPDFGSGCATNNTADVTGENLEASGSYFGAGSQLATLATGDITTFATDTTNNEPTNLGGSTNGLPVGGAAASPSGLAFANTTAGGTNHGGGFGRTDWCVTDYDANAMNNVTAGTPDYTTPGTRTYVLPDGSNIGSITIAPGAHVTLVVQGNVFVNGNINYGNYTSATNMPQFTLIAENGLYIKNDVATLNGTYVAQPKDSGSGTIYTCALGINAPATDYATCNHQLTFYGSVSATKLVLGRTWGSLRTSGATTNAAGEQFVYTPELWLGNLIGPSCSAADLTQPGCMYQAYTGLPPVL